ncbi:MAG: helix-hairpin-helix domain-containing protein [Promethearchaeota archaeon]
MTPSLEDVKGVGKKAEVLKGAGIDTPEKLANSTIDDLKELKGIGGATAQKLIDSAKELIQSENSETQEEVTEEKIDEEEEKKIQEEIKRLEEKRKNLQGKKVEDGDFILVKITGRTEKGRVFRVSSPEDAKKAGIYDEQRAQQGYYTPEFVIVGKPGFVNEGLTEVIKDMNFFEKKSVRIPPSKAFGKRDPQKIERIGIAKFRKMNEGKNPEIGAEFHSKKLGSGIITNINQGKVIVDYNHPLAGQHLDYNLEIVDKIEEFNDKVEYFMVNKGIPKETVPDFKANYNEEDKSIEFTVPKQFIFQNLAMLQFSLSYDLQTNMPDEIGDVKFVHLYEKMPMPMPSAADSVMQKVDDFNKEEESTEDSEE